MQSINDVFLLHLMDGMGTRKNLTPSEFLFVKFQVFCKNDEVLSVNSKQIKSSRLMVWDERIELSVPNSSGALAPGSSAFIRLSLISCKESVEQLEALFEDLLCDFSSTINSEATKKHGTIIDNPNLLSRKDRIVTLTGVDISASSSVRIRLGK